MSTTLCPWEQILITRGPGACLRIAAFSMLLSACVCVSGKLAKGTPSIKCPPLLPNKAGKTPHFCQRWQNRKSIIIIYIYPLLPVLPGFPPHTAFDFCQRWQNVWQIWRNPSPLDIHCLSDQNFLLSFVFAILTSNAESGAALGRPAPLNLSHETA